MSAQAVCSEIWLNKGRIDYSALKMEYSESDISQGIVLFIKEKRQVHEEWGDSIFYSHLNYKYNLKQLKPVTTTTKGR